MNNSKNNTPVHFATLFYPLIVESLKVQLSDQEEIIAYYQQLDWAVNDTVDSQRKELAKSKIDDLINENQKLKNQLSVVRPVFIMAKSYLEGNETEGLQRALETRSVNEFISQKFSRAKPVITSLKKAV